MSAPVLDLHGVNKSFGAVQALTDVDFHVDAGEVVALVGDNGAGKSTLVKAISGVSTADSGEFLFEGTPAQHPHALRTPPRSASRPSTRTSRWPTTSTSPATSSSVASGSCPACSAALYMLDDLEHGEALERADPLALVTHPQRHDAGRLALGRAAAGGRDRALAAGRAEAGDAGRADGRPGRGPDAAGARPDHDAQGARPGGRRDQPQPRSTSSRSPTASRCSTSAATPATSSSRTPPARRWSARSPAARPSRPPAAGTGWPHEHQRTARSAPPGRRRGLRRPLDALHPPREGGRARLPSGHRRPDRHLAVLLLQGGELPHRRQHHQPDAPDHGGRDHRHGHRAGAAARRDRPVGGDRQRPRRLGDGGPERAARMARLGRHPGGPGHGSGVWPHPGLLHHLLPGALVRGHPRRVARLPGASPLGPRLHRHGQRLRHLDHRPGQHVLQPGRGVDHRPRHPGPVRAADPLRVSPPRGVGPRRRAVRPDPHPARGRLRRCDRRGGRSELRPRGPARHADLRRRRDRGRLPHPAHGVRPPRLRGRWQRRGGAPRGYLALPHPHRRSSPCARRSRRSAESCSPRGCSP